MNKTKGQVSINSESSSNTLISLNGAVQAFRVVIHPTPLLEPTISIDFSRLSTLERIVEVLRYKLLQLEYWISPSGGFRAYIKLNLIVCFLIGIPALFIVPLVTHLLGEFVTWTDYLFHAVLNLAQSVLIVLGIIGAIVFGVKNIRR